MQNLTLLQDSSLTLITLYREAGKGLMPDIHSGNAKGLSSGVHICLALTFIFGLKFVKIGCGVVMYVSWLSWLEILFVIITLSILLILLPWHIDRFSILFIWKMFWGFGLSPILQRLSKLDQTNGLSLRAFFHTSTALALRSVLMAIFPSKARANEAWSPNSSVKSSKLLADWLFSKRAASASAYLDTETQNKTRYISSEKKLYRHFLTNADWIRNNCTYLEYFIYVIEINNW